MTMIQIIDPNTGTSAYLANDDFRALIGYLDETSDED